MTLEELQNENFARKEDFIKSVILYCAKLTLGGRMILPVGRTFATQDLILITKDAKGKISQENLMPVRFVPMVPGNSK